MVALTVTAIDCVMYEPQFDQAGAHTFRGESMKVIDAHIHVGLKCFFRGKDNGLIQALWNTYENTIAIMNQNEVEQAVILPIPHSEVDTKKSNNYLWEAYNSFPDRFIPFCRIDDELEKNLQKGFRGVKLHLLYEQMELKSIKKELQIIEDVGVPLLLHAKFRNKIKQVQQILKYAPNIKVILAHMGRGHVYTGEQVVDNAIGLRQYPNVYVDTSTVGDIKAIINVCEILSYDRVLYGSDYPFGKSLLNEQYDYSQEAITLISSFDRDQAKKIMYENISRLLSLHTEPEVLVRRAKKSDLPKVIALIEQLDETDKKYLALSSKYALIKQTIRSERHCYVACWYDEVVGFLRESGRPNGYSLLEEIVVSSRYRNKGIGNSMLLYYHNIFSKNLAKTNAKNTTIIHLLRKNGYVTENPDAPRIVSWTRVAEES